MLHYFTITPVSRCKVHTVGPTVEPALLQPSAMPWSLRMVTYDGKGADLVVTPLGIKSSQGMALQHPKNCFPPWGAGTKGLSCVPTASGPTASVQIYVRGTKLNGMLPSLGMELEKNPGIMKPCSPLVPAPLLRGLLGAGGRGQSGSTQSPAGQHTAAGRCVGGG